MRTSVVACLLLLCLAVPLLAQVSATEETVETTQTTDPSGTVTTSTTTTKTAGLPEAPPPAWIHLVRLAATAGPIAFLLLAWLAGAIVHFRLVHREQAQFPLTRGSRAPQTTPMLISGLLFLVPAVLFVFFEIRSRIELRRGLTGVVDEWHPVTAHAWIALVVCFVLALMPWLFARRADTVS
jgi:hypothetical protein